MTTPYIYLPQMAPPTWDCTPTPVRAMTDDITSEPTGDIDKATPDPIPEGEDEGDSPVPVESAESESGTGEDDASTQDGLA